jgi:hypothetical protein
VQLGRNRSRPRRTVRARPVAMWGTARVRGAGGPRRERAAALPGVARLDGGAARRVGGGSAPAHGRWRGNGGSPARRRRRETASARAWAASDRGGRDGAAGGEATVGTRWGRRGGRDDGAECGASIGAARRAGQRLSGRAALSRQRL